MLETIINDPMNREYTKNQIMPLYVFDAQAKILLIGQAPGIKAQTSMIAFKDASGETLKKWLGVDEDTFRDPKNFSILPMDFYYPGKGKSGDNPPRKDFAQKFHPLFIEQMKDLQMIILIGQYAQKYYLKKRNKQNLTQTVKAYEEYYPPYFPIVHPSPLNFRWFIKNPWFVQEVVPSLQAKVKQILSSS